MSWFSRITRFGDLHLVYGQEAANSCGIACVMMTVFKINKLAPGKKALHKEKEIYDVYSKVSGSAYDGSSYSYANFLADTLNKLNVGKWTAEPFANTAVPQKICDYVGTSGPIGPIINVTPIIVLVGWNAGGAHFVCIDTVRSVIGSLYATVCDPWDANVHVTSMKVGQPFAYTGAQVPGIDFGGSHHDYSMKSPGQANGWIVHPTS